MSCLLKCLFMSLYIFGLSAATLKGCPKECTCTTSSSYDESVRVNCRNKLGPKQTTPPTTFPLHTKYIDISNNNIEILQFSDEAAENLDELIFLNATGNKIREIQYDAFDSLQELTTLILSNNRIQRIADDVFEWNPLKLKRLKLDNNNMEYIQHFLFYDLQDLEEIDMSYNSLSFIHPHAFTELTKLVTLNLANNKLNYFQDKWISRIMSESLNSIQLHNNTFQCDCQLKDDNMQNFLDNGDLKQMIRYALYNGNSKYGTIKCHDSNGKGELDLLSLSSSDSSRYTCQKPTITGISKSAKVPTQKSLLLKCKAEGKPLPQIEWKAPNGDTYRLTADDFEGVTVHRDGSILIEDIRKSDDGDYTCMAKNKEGSVEAKTQIEVTGDDPVDDPRGGNRDEDDWEDWDDGENVIDWVDGELIDEHGDQAHKDEYTLIDDMDTDIDIIRDDDFEYQKCPIGCECMSNLADCGQAAKLTIPTSIPDHILHLDMNNNDIQKIEYDVCRNYKTLRELKVDDNKIVEIENNAFRNCGKLTILTMRNNRLATLPQNTFDGLNELQILVLDNNLIQHLQNDVFSELEKLEYLYIRENSVKTIDSKAFHKLNSLRFIHLEENEIGTLKRDWLDDATNQETNSKLKRVFLSDNKFICDARIYDFKDDFKKNNDRSPIYNAVQPADLICDYPPEQRERTLEDVDYNKLPALGAGPGDSSSSSSASGGLMIAGILIGAILTGFAIVAWRKWNRRNGMSRFGPGLHSYQDISQEDNESRALTADQEAFI